MNKSAMILSTLLSPEGLVYFVSWENDLNVVKIGLSRSLRKRLNELCVANAHRLMIRKVLWASNALELEKMLHEKFAAHRISGEWFHLSPAIVEFLQGEDDRHTYKAEASAVGARIGMAPILHPQSQRHAPRRLANGIKVCRHYLLWLLADCMEHCEKVTARSLFGHPTNDGRFAIKTIRNELSMLVQRDMVNHDRHKGLLVTIFGLKELERLNAKIRMNH